MTATERLRELLDERGVNHYDGTESTLWLKDEHGYRASADELTSGRMSVHIWCDTPEQAIDATLGAGTCRMKFNADYSYDEIYPTMAYECSACGNLTMDGKPNFCPNCGRKVVDG